ncbi:hypothetical protein MLD38_012163 [Melastoma candidum]|uniref:Uncharacterized protein n=1 Tax=Melastoma candidum TaxID=119954 RepID=A0ACB9R5F3_9MYRT|nr:hypothetical protein MLD38_012163 [Melastoma candidum]
MSPPPPQLSPEILHALTHLLTTPSTATPDLHSQLLISTLLHPSALPSHYPPVLSSPPSRHLGHGLGLFLRRISPFRAPTTSWRSKCPYQQPPPAVLARGLEEARWGDEGRRAYFRARLRRKRLGSDLHPLVPFLIPNLLLFTLLLWDPVIPDR